MQYAPLQANSAGAIPDMMRTAPEEMLHPEFCSGASLNEQVGMNGWADHLCGHLNLATT